MGKKDSRVDAYIAASADFAQPILRHLRKLIHQACPEIEETIKWHMPYFQFNGILCGFAAFSQHAALIFWRDLDIVPKSGQSNGALGQFGRITRREDLPSDEVLLGYLRKAVALRMVPPLKEKPRSQPISALVVPPDLKTALTKNEMAAATFLSLPQSHQREYVRWITEAKREDTRSRRIVATLERLADGKSQNDR